MKRNFTCSVVRLSSAKTIQPLSGSNAILRNSEREALDEAGVYCLANGKIAASLNRKLFLVILFFISFAGLKAQVDNTTVFPLNEYLTTEKGSPYPILVQSKLDDIDTSKFVNVMDYGAKGDGKTWDDEAIEKAFNSARYGVIFPANRTFLVHKLTKIHLDRDMTVYAYGAIIRMDDLSRYSFLSLEYDEGSYHNKVIWLGGRLACNKGRQSWPGSPTGNNTWEEDHGRFLGICYAEFALVKDVTVVGPVMDGIGLEACKIAVIADSKGYGGAPIKYSEVQDQGTYFKCTRYGSQAFYCMNLECNGGSIGVHYSTKSVEDKSLTVVTNSRFYNQSQDALHFEDCKKIFLYKCTVERDIAEGYQADVHISNSAQIASIKSCQFRNARIDFRNATDLEIGVVDSCKFVSEFTGGDVSYLNTLVWGATHCINSSFSGKTDEEQVWADNVQNCDFTNYNDLALRGPHVTSYSSFEQDNGDKNDGTSKDQKSISPAKDGVVVDCSFDNNEDADYRKPDDNNWKKPFLSSITIVSDKDEYLGRITCGGEENKTTKVTSTTQTASAMGASASSPLKRSVTFNNSSKGNKTVAPNALGINNNLPFKAIGNQRISLYPNPAAELLHVTLNDQVTGKTELRIYNQQGRMIQTKSIYKNTPVLVASMDVSRFAAGAYVLQIISEGERSSFKFLIER